MRHSSKFSLRVLMVVGAFLVATHAWGNYPLVRSAADTYVFQSTGVGTGTTLAVALTYDSNGTGELIYINQLAIVGNDASDFKALPPSCEAGDPLYFGAPTCTLYVQYTPTKPGQESAHLRITCSDSFLVVGTGSDQAAGSFSLACIDNSVGSISLLGNTTPPATVPAYDPRLLGILAVFLLYFGARVINTEKAAA